MLEGGIGSGRGCGASGQAQLGLDQWVPQLRQPWHWLAQERVQLRAGGVQGAARVWFIFAFLNTFLLVVCRGNQVLSCSQGALSIKRAALTP